jgi:hypothetical protein
MIGLKLESKRKAKIREPNFPVPFLNGSHNHDGGPIKSLVQDIFTKLFICVHWHVNMQSPHISEKRKKKKIPVGLEVSHYVRNKIAFVFSWQTR